MRIAAEIAQSMRDFLDGKPAVKPVKAKAADEALTVKETLSDVFLKAAHLDRPHVTPAQPVSAWDQLVATIDEFKKLGVF